MLQFHTVQSTLPYDKNQFVRAQRARQLTPAVVAADNMDYLAMNLHHEKNHFKVGRKGTKSKTRKGDMNFTTKRGDKDYHRGGKDIKQKRAPFKKKRY